MPRAIINIPMSQIERVNKALAPIPVDEDRNPEFTAREWVTEILLRYLIDRVWRYELETAREKIDIKPDNDLATGE